MKVTFIVGEREHGPFCSWSRDGSHKCTSHKTSPIKPTQRSWKELPIQRELPLGASSKKNDVEQGSHE
jgi:hypothetical protein